MTSEFTQSHDLRAAYRAESAWTLTEAANEPFFTLVQRYVFPPFFVGTLAASTTPGAGAATWGFVTAAAGLLVGIGAPIMGAIADTGGRRRPFLIVVATLAFLTSALLWFATPDRSLALIVAVSIIALAAFELLSVLTNAFLPTAARRATPGKLSGLAFAFGQLAGIGALVMVIALSDAPPRWAAEVPGFVDRLAGPIAALALLVFLTPALIWLRDPPGPPKAYAIIGGLRELRVMLVEAWRDRQLRLFFIGRAVGGDGVALVFAFGAVLGGQTFGWSAGTLATFGIGVTLASALGGFGAVALDRRLGARNTIIVGFVLVLVGLFGLLAMGPSSVLGIDTATPLNTPFTSPQEQAFVFAAVIIALGAGPVIAGMRALMAEIAPPARVSACFGLYAFVGKATNFAGPLVLGIVVSVTGSLRLGLSTAAIFILGGIACYALMPHSRLPRAA